MQCPKCGRPMDENDRCSYCEAEAMREETITDDKVRVMTPEEKVEYHGVTIDESQQEPRDNLGFEHSHGWRDHVVFHQVHLGDVSWTSKLALILILAAILLFVLFIALPVAVIGLVVGAVVWALLSFLRG